MEAVCALLGAPALIATVALFLLAYYGCSRLDRLVDGKQATSCMRARRDCSGHLPSSPRLLLSPVLVSLLLVVLRL